MNSFTKPWGPFIRGIVAREVMPTWERMWDDFVQEEIRLAARLLDSSSSSQFLVLRTLLFGQRARRRPVMEVSRVPSLGPHHREERATTVVGRRET
jgi:hypothetical protein